MESSTKQWSSSVTLGSNYADNFNNRIEIGKAVEAEFINFMKYLDKPVQFTGYENLFPEWLVEKLKNAENNLYTTTTRQFPDFTSGCALYQVKSGLGSSKYDSVTIEQSSFNTCKNISEMLNAPVFITWLMPDGRFWGNFASDIKVHEPYRQSASTGSGDPYYLVKKSQLKPLEEFIDIL